MPRRRGSTWKKVKLVLWLVVLIAGFAGWRLLPSLLQKAGPVVDIACGSAAATTPPRTDLTVGCAPVAPTVDGEFDDWRSVTTHEVAHVVDARGGVREGFTSTWQLLWDKEALYVHARVTDPEIIPVDVSKPGSFWTGDGISFEFGPDASKLTAKDLVRTGHDFHVMIGLVDDGDRAALASINSASKGTFPAGARAPDIDVVRRPTADGYELEARIPWNQLGLTVAPARGTVVTMNLNVSDARSPGALKAMVSSNAERTKEAQPHPALWQTVLLGDEG